jgi:hypothetical protein
MDLSPAQWQQSHDPVVPDERVIDRRIDPVTGKVTVLKRAVYQVRARDKMIWGRFSPAQTQAAEDICRGRDAIIGSMGAKAQSLDPPVDYGHGDSEARMNFAARLSRQYAAWMRECPRRGIVNSYVIAIVCEGMSMRQTMQTYRKGHEAISGSLYAGLDLYVEMFG